MESLIRKPYIGSLSDTITFQALEWVDDNVEVDYDENNETDIKKYIIKIFGVTDSGYSICASVINYTPFFYIKVPDSFVDSHLKKLLAFLTEFNNEDMKAHLNDSIKSFIWNKFNKNRIIKDKCKILLKKDFYGFTNCKLFKFVRLVFDNSEAYKFCTYNIFNG